MSVFPSLSLLLFVTVLVLVTVMLVVSEPVESNTIQPYAM